MSNGNCPCVKYGVISDVKCANGSLEPMDGIQVEVLNDSNPGEAVRRMVAE